MFTICCEISIPERKLWKEIVIKKKRNYRRNIRHFQTERKRLLTIFWLKLEYYIQKDFLYFKLLSKYDNFKNKKIFKYLMS